MQTEDKTEKSVRVCERVGLLFSAGVRHQQGSSRTSRPPAGSAPPGLGLSSAPPALCPPSLSVACLYPSGHFQSGTISPAGWPAPCFAVWSNKQQIINLG